MTSARCLVVDDHPALVRAVADFLEASGVEVVGEAPDGARALELLERGRPDVAVVDFRMPRFAGTALIERLRAVAPRLRVVVYTADADEAVVRGALEAGASAIVLKESPLPDLVRAIRTSLNGSTYVDPALAPLGPAARTPADLTERELQVLRLLSEGLSHDEVGRTLSISGETARAHMRKACERLGATTRTQAVATALRRGLIS